MMDRCCTWAALAGGLLLGGCALSSAPPERQALAAHAVWAAAPHTALPAPGTLAPGDQVDIFVWGYEDLSRKVTVKPNGMLAYTLLGELHAAGKSVHQLQHEITEGLKDYVRAPIVRLGVSTPRAARLFVLGEVKNPGMFPMATMRSSLIESVAAAGGLTSDANQDEVLVLREEGNNIHVLPVNFRQLVRGAAPGNLYLREGDIVYVPPTALTDIARSARRVVDVLTPVLAGQQVLLNLQASTLVWKQFVRALRGEESATPGTQNIIITPPR